MYKTPFKSIGNALAFYNFKNPARHKCVNLLEIEGLSTQYTRDFSGTSSRDLFAAVTWAIKKTLLLHTREQQAAFVLREFGDSDSRLHVHDISKKLGRSKTTIYRWIANISDDLENELQRRELIPKPDKYY